MNAPPTSVKQSRQRYRKISPLSYERVAILNAVATGPIDRSQIAGQVKADTVAAIVISKSTVYSLIRELTLSGYIEQRGSYQLTDKGWRTLRQELFRIEEQRRLLKQRLHV